MPATPESSTARDGVLHLLPVPIAPCSTPESLRLTLPEAVIAHIAGTQTCFVENAKTARGIIKLALALYPDNLPLQSRELCEFQRCPPGQIDALLRRGIAGETLGLMSEAGMPAIADPGREIVRRAHQLGLRVQTHSGPSSLMLALAASGLQGQRFAFHGYLPQAREARAAALLDLQRRARMEDATQLFIETPYRNAALWASMLQVLGPDTRVLAAQGLTGETEQVVCDTVQAMRQSGWSPDANTPCLFGLAQHEASPASSRAGS